MGSLRILAGNTNSLFRNNICKFKEWNAYEVIIWADSRVSRSRLDSIKKAGNWVGKVNQFYASLSLEFNPKHGCLIFINCSIIEKILDFNNQEYMHEVPRLAFVTAKLKGMGVVNIIGVYLPTNGGVNEKVRVLGKLMKLCERLSSTSNKFIIGGI